MYSALRSKTNLYVSSQLAQSPVILVRCSSSASTALVQRARSRKADSFSSFSKLGKTTQSCRTTFPPQYNMPAPRKISP